MLDRPLLERGYVFVAGRDMRQELMAVGSLADWPAFAASWNDLEVDRYLAESGRFRRRRFGVYSVNASGDAVRQAHQAHFQYPEHNTLFGGIERWFEPIAPEIGAGPTMTTVLRFCAGVFGSLARRSASPAKTDVSRRSANGAKAEVHQFRIEARADLAGQPTPEGAHRDGVDFVLVLLVNRENIVSGMTTVYDPGGRPLGSFTLTDPFDAALVDDNRVAHGVTPVEPLDPARPACRDVLVVTFRKSL